MNLRNRVAFYFVTRLLGLMIIWLLLIVISMLLFSFFLDYNKTETPQLSINKIVEKTIIKDLQFTIDSKIKQDLQKNQMWLQILDTNGEEIFSFNKPEEIHNHYTPGELVADYLYPAKNGYQLSTWIKTIENQNLTWIVGKPIDNNSPFLYWVNNLWIISIIIIGIVILLYFGKRLGAPLLYVVSWIENLSKGRYYEPSDYLNFHSKRQLRNNTAYRTYPELMESLSKLTSTLKHSQNERELLEKTREEWMTGISHDLKTPLSVIKGYIVLLSSYEYNWQPKEVQDFAKTMEERVEYMEQLIEDFNLTFQLKNDALPINPQKTDLVEMIKRIVEHLKKLSESKNKEFLFNTNKEQIFLNMDNKYLKRAFENLIANSIKHNPPGTIVKIIINEDRSHSGKIQIIIEDNGVGMDEETINHLFDRYYRGISSSSNNFGTGLGMAISRQILIAHGGEIEINSKLKRGTQYKITFPITF